MKPLQLLTSALLASAVAMPGAFAQTAAGAGGANLPSQRIVNESANGTGAALTLSPATVRRVQQVLNRLGYNAGNVTGNWDRPTRLAVAHFQQARGLAPTGTLDEATLSTLGVGIGAAGNAAAINGTYANGGGLSGGFGNRGAYVSSGAMNGTNGNGAAMNGGYENGAAMNGANGNGAAMNGASGNGAAMNGARINRGYYAGVGGSNPNVPGSGLSAGNLSSLNRYGANPNSVSGNTADGNAGNTAVTGSESGVGANSGLPPVRGGELGTATGANGAAAGVGNGTTGSSGAVNAGTQAGTISGGALNGANGGAAPTR